MRYRCGRCNELPPVLYLKNLSADESREKFSWLSWADKVMQRIREMEVLAINTNITAGKMSVPIWEKYMLTVDEAVQYFGIGKEDKIINCREYEYGILFYGSGGE